MANVKVTLKDGSVKEFAAGSSYLEIAKSLNQKLGKQALLAVVDGVRHLRPLGMPFSRCMALSSSRLHATGTFGS